VAAQIEGWLRDSRRRPSTVGADQLPVELPRTSSPHRLGPYSSVGALAGLDGRTWEYLYVKKYQAELTAHLGGNLTYIQQQLVERCAWLQLKLTMLDLRLAKDDGRRFTQQDNNVYLAWTNSLARTLLLLGVTVGKGIKKPRALRGHKLITPGDGETVADLVGR
jgi:hypothetical protein